MARNSFPNNSNAKTPTNGNFRRLISTPFFWLLLCFLSTAVAANFLVGQDKPTSLDGTVSSETPGPSAGQLRREGVRIDGEVARFIVVGDRIHAEFKQTGQSYRVLENLSLDRIANAMKQDSHDYYWKITGPLTEFQGQNFLLIEHAVRAPKGAAY